MASEEHGPGASAHGSERRFEALLESAPDGILLVDAEGRIRLVNQRVEAMFGHRRDELLGRPVEVLIPEGTGLDPFGRRRDGTRFPVEVSRSPLAGDDDEDALVITVVRDATEQRQHEGRRIELARSETARRASEAEGDRLRRVQALYDEALTWLGSSDQLLPAMLERVRGWMDADAAAALVLEPGTEDDLRVRASAGVDVPAGASFPGAAATAPRVVDDPATVAGPLAADGRLQSLAIAPMAVGGGVMGAVHVGARRAGAYSAEDAALLARFAERIALALGQARMFESERAATGAAQAAESRLRELLGDLAAVVWEADSADRRRFRFISDSAEPLLGHPVSAWTDEDGLWQRMIDPADREHVLEQAARATAAGREHELEYRVHVEGRGPVWLRDTVRPIRLGHGEVRLRGVTVDVTERRELEGRLLQAQKMQAVGQLAGGIAHDFNNLLTVIIGYTTMLSARVSAGQDLEDLGEVRRAAERAQALTGQLLSFSRRQAQRTGLVDLNEAVAGLEPMLRRLLDEDIELVIRLAERAVLVEADAAQLEQVVVNLVVNARDAMPAGGAMRIAVADDPAGSPGPWGLLTVSDTGTGMSPEVRERIFEPFFTTKELGAGTGLGLATVYGIVDRAGGAIEVDSEVGRGTDIEIRLPMAHATAEVPAAAAPEDPPGPHVLVVEDERAVRALISRVLQGDGWTVLEAADGREALELLAGHAAPLDLLITDIVMPGMSGPELVSRVAERMPELPVIFTSGYTDSRLAGRQFDETSVDLLRKPFLPDDLRRRARAAIGAPVAD